MGGGTKDPGGDVLMKPMVLGPGGTVPKHAPSPPHGPAAMSQHGMAWHAGHIEVFASGSIRGRHGGG